MYLVSDFVHQVRMKLQWHHDVSLSSVVFWEHNRRDSLWTCSIHKHTLISETSDGVIKTKMNNNKKNLQRCSYLVTDPTLPFKYSRINILGHDLKELSCHFYSAFLLKCYVSWELSCNVCRITYLDLFLWIMGNICGEGKFNYSQIYIGILGLKWQNGKIKVSPLNF